MDYHLVVVRSVASAHLDNVGYIKAHIVVFRILEVVDLLVVGMEFFHSFESFIGHTDFSVTGVDSVVEIILSPSEVVVANSQGTRVIILFTSVISHRKAHIVQSMYHGIDHRLLVVDNSTNLVLGNRRICGIQFKVTKILQSLQAVLHVPESLLLWFPLDPLHLKLSSFGILIQHEHEATAEEPTLWVVFDETKIAQNLSSSVSGQLVAAILAKVVRRINLLSSLDITRSSHFHRSTLVVHRI
mmetsp:Transcript_18967/g.31450  ORF Transcript_18967/g.31450 Transcript_18967/m.31450 type:complete len:243 (-) Transcript_18967:703-1431(-)